MILPTKHINFSQSFLGLGAYILSQLSSTKTIDEIWENYKIDYRNDVYPAKHSFDNFVMTLIFLYGTESICVYKETGKIVKCV